MWKKKIKHMSKKKLVKRSCIVLLLVGVLGAAGFTLFIQPMLEKDTYIYKETTATVGDLTVGIMESGYVEAELSNQDYELDLTTDEDSDSDSDTESSSDSEDSTDEETTEKYLKIEEMYVAVGQRVNQGDALFSLTEDSIGDVRYILETNVREAEIALAEAELSYMTDLLGAANDCEEEIAGQGVAKGQYDNTVAQLTNKITELNNKIIIAQKNKESAREELDDLESSDNYEDVIDAYKEAKAEFEDTTMQEANLYIIREDEYNTQKSKYDDLMSQVEQLNDKITEEAENIASYQEELSLLTNSNLLKEMEARQDYDSDVLSGSIAGSQYEFEENSLKDNVTTAQTDLDDANEQLASFEEFVGDGIVKAEYTGLIMELNYEADDSFTTTGTIVSYVTDNCLTLTVDVSQEDISSVSVNEAVTIDFTAYPDVVYEGIVTAITTTVEDSSSSTVSYPVTIQILGDTDPIFEGMSGNVTFVTDKKEAVLSISEKAVFEENGRSYVYYKNSAGEREVKEVETGFTNGTNVEIISGLSEGDIVYISSKVSDEGVK